jgi:SAM-dependent methyltransferase
MPTDFFQKAIDPKQYDDERIDWTSEATVDSPFRKFVLDYLRDFLSEVTGKRVIDIGAGTGWLVKVLVELEAGSITAVEPSEKGAKFMREQHPSVIVQCATVDTMEHEGFFDIGFMLYVANHLEDLTKSFKSLVGVIKQGGIFVITIPDFEYVKKNRLSEAEVETIADDMFVAAIPREFGTSYDIYRTTETYIKAAEQAGFELIEQTSMIPTDGLMIGYPRFKEFKGQSISQMLSFKKI